MWTLCILLVLTVTSSAYLILVSQVRVVELTEMTQQSRLTNAAMLNQESSLRGWLATGDKDFLRPYRQGSRDWDMASDVLLGSLVRPDINEDIVTMQLTIRPGRSGRRAPVPWTSATPTAAAAG